MAENPATQTGCFAVSYPSTVWEPTHCISAPTIPLLPYAGGAVPSTVGNGNDEVAQSPSAPIGSSVGSFAVSGLASETDNQYGANNYGLQINSQFFMTTTLYTMSKPTLGWEQFVWINWPYSGNTVGVEYIQYWLIGYQTSYGSCPTSRIPAGTSWYAYSTTDCYANSNAIATPLEQATNLANIGLEGFANYHNSAADANVFCVSGTCYQLSVTDQILNLSQNWLDSEFNIFGTGTGSEAQFNPYTMITVTNSLKDQSGNPILPSCVNTGYTGESNNLNLVTGSCASRSGQIEFTETNSPSSRLDFLTQPSGGGTIQLQSPAGNTTVGGTDNTAGESKNILSAQIQPTAPLIVTQLGIYVSSFSTGAAVTLGLYYDDGGDPNTGMHAPSALIAQTDQVQITAANTWLFGKLRSSVILSANVLYWVAIETNSVNKALYWSEGGGSFNNACGIVYTGNMPNVYPSCTGGQTSAYFYEAVVAGSLAFPNGTSFWVPSASYPVIFVPYSGYMFSSWSTSGSVSASSNTDNPMTMTVSALGTGTLTANLNSVVTLTSMTTTTSSSTTTTSSISTFQTSTTTTSTSTSISTVGQVCYSTTNTTQTTSVIVQGTVTSGTVTSTLITTTISSSTASTTMSFTSTSKSVTSTTTTTSVCLVSTVATSTSITFTTSTVSGHLLIPISLHAGWNLISLPVVPLSTSISDLLKSQIATHDVLSVWSYTGTPRSWESYIPGQSGTLTTMTDGNAYWIFMTRNDTLYVDGTVIPPNAVPAAYSLVQGWNLVGFKPEPSLQNESVGTYLSSIEGSYDVNNVWVYANGWVRADSSFMLQPGEGMWVLMTSSATLRP